jgi:hypothetical protein
MILQHVKVKKLLSLPTHPRSSMMDRESLVGRQRHGEKEEDRAADRGSVAAKGENVRHLKQGAESESLWYYTVTKGGVERVSMMQFLNALIEADGIELDGKAASDGRPGRSAKLPP